MKIGEAIRAMRQLKGMTLKEVGERVGTSKASLSKIELASSITFKKLVEVAEAIEVSPSDIVKMTEPDRKESRALELLRRVHDLHQEGETSVIKDAISVTIHEREEEELRDHIKDFLNTAGGRDNA
jgi:transcriptional regulator with XRE-family HTH domain